MSKDFAADIQNKFKLNAANPFATFVWVWMLEHYDVFVIMIFSVSPVPGTAEAETKLNLIRSILVHESFWLRYGRPAFIAVLLLFSGQILLIGWNKFFEWCREINAKRILETDARLRLPQFLIDSPEEYFNTVNQNIVTLRKFLERLSTSPVSLLDPSIVGERKDEDLVAPDISKKVKTELNSLKELHTKIGIIFGKNV